MLEYERVGGELIEKRSTGCPFKSVSQFAEVMMELYGHYKQGHLLMSGTIAHQPNWYVEAMSVIQAEFNKAERARADEEKRKLEMIEKRFSK